MIQWWKLNPLICCCLIDAFVPLIHLQVQYNIDLGINKMGFMELCPCLFIQMKSCRFCSLFLNHWSSYTDVTLPSRGSSTAVWRTVGVSLGVRVANKMPYCDMRICFLYLDNTLGSTYTTTDNLTTIKYAWVSAWWSSSDLVVTFKNFSLQHIVWIPVNKRFPATLSSQK